MDRRTELLHRAAASLDAGEVPLTSEWLAAHDVTADEVSSLAAHIAVGCRVVATGLTEPRSLAGVVVTKIIAEENGQ